MKTKLSDNLRKWTGLLTAILVYYLIHEGSHLLFALAFGAFREIRFLGLGVQVVIEDSLMTRTQLALFCLAGSAAALAGGYGLAALTDRIVQRPGKYGRAMGYYTTLALLLADPVYLSVLYRFFGGGDMNGILLLGLPEPLIQGIYAALGIANLQLFRKKIYPKYKAAAAQ